MGRRGGVERESSSFAMQEPESVPSHHCRWKRLVCPGSLLEAVPSGLFSRISQTDHVSNLASFNMGPAFAGVASVVLFHGRPPSELSPFPERNIPGHLTITSTA